MSSSSATWATCDPSLTDSQLSQLLRWDWELTKDEQRTGTDDYENFREHVQEGLRRQWGWSPHYCNGWVGQGRQFFLKVSIFHGDIRRVGPLPITRWTNQSIKQMRRSNAKNARNPEMFQSRVVKSVRRTAQINPKLSRQRSFISMKSPIDPAGSSRGIFGKRRLALASECYKTATPPHDVSASVNWHDDADCSPPVAAVCAPWRSRGEPG